MDLNFPVFATGVCIFRASNDVGPLFLGPGSTRILEIFSRPYIVTREIQVHRSSACGISHQGIIIPWSHTKNNIQLTNKELVWKYLLLLSNTSLKIESVKPRNCVHGQFTFKSIINKTKNNQTKITNYIYVCTVACNMYLKVGWESFKC
jgi:hypothetical protein